MYSVEQSFSRLFRPWDMCDKKEQQNSEKRNPEEVKKKKKMDKKRENRLRKIRGNFKKETNLHQDATVSTTTEDKPITPKTSEISDPVMNLAMCCNRLLQEPEKLESKPKEIQPSYSNAAPINTIPTVYNPSYDYIQTDIAQALGLPPTDPLLLESLAQGYAMELEYARVLQQENEAKLLNAKKQRPKKYRCPHCNVGFSNNGQLKGHIRIHTGERPYKCDEKNCGKTFTRNEELTRHKRIHSGVRPYPCPTCGKKFGRRDHLKKHTRTHFMQAERMMPVFVPLSAVPHIGGFPYLYGY